ADLDAHARRLLGLGPGERGLRQAGRGRRREHRQPGEHHGHDTDSDPSSPTHRRAPPSTRTVGDGSSYLPSKSFLITCPALSSAPGLSFSLPAFSLSLPALSFSLPALSFSTATGGGGGGCGATLTRIS